MLKKGEFRGWGGGQGGDFTRGFMRKRWFAKQEPGSNKCDTEICRRLPRRNWTRQEVIREYRGQEAIRGVTGSALLVTGA